jgi:hypothetical protein
MVDKVKLQEEWISMCWCVRWCWCVDAYAPPLSRGGILELGLNVCVVCYIHDYMFYKQLRLFLSTLSSIVPSVLPTKVGICMPPLGHAPTSNLQGKFFGAAGKKARRHHDVSLLRCFTTLPCRKYHPIPFIYTFNQYTKLLCTIKWKIEPERVNGRTASVRDAVH